MTAVPMARAALCAASLALASPTLAHDAHETFAAGAPGDPGAPARTVDLAIHELPGGRMSFGTDAIRAELGQQIRFVVTNDGQLRHEFRLDSASGNAAHKAMMAKMPGMVHHDPNAMTLAPSATGTLVWRFTKPGTYEFACLLPGHYEAGMHGTVTVGK